MFMKNNRKEGEEPFNDWNEMECETLLIFIKKS